MAENTLENNLEQDEQSQEAIEGLANKKERLEWYQDMAIGMYLYWTVDAQFGMVNAHSVIGASEDYLEKYFNLLPQTFCPGGFDADWYARTAKCCGFDYLCIPVKNHNGFCLWDTDTTDFNVMNTPLKRDVIQEITDAARRWGVAISLYFSPDDAWWQWRHGNEPARLRDYCLPGSNPALEEYDKKQIKEIIQRYSPDMVCYDSPRPLQTRGLVEYTWELNSEILVTRGAITTPEQKLGDTLRGPFEAHYTIGKQWQYRAGNDDNKTGRELISLLSEVRSLGGTFLLAIGGPDADGLLPKDKDNLVRELGLWLFVNGEAVKNVRPWRVTQEKGVFYTKAKDSDTVYAILDASPHPKNEWRVVHLKGVDISEKSTIKVLGQSESVVEYRPEETSPVSFEKNTQGLRICYQRHQRLYNDNKWPNQVVLKITYAV